MGPHKKLYLSVGLAGSLMGVVDALLDEMWDLKAFLWALILSTLMLYDISILLTVKFTGRRKLYIFFTAIGLNNWNITWALIMYLLYGEHVHKWGRIWLAPYVIVPVWLYFAVIIPLFIAWIIYYFIIDKTISYTAVP